MRFAILVAISLFTLAACAIDSKPRANLSNPERVTAIKFVISTDNFAKIAITNQTTQMAEEISRHLISWGYPVKAGTVPDEAFTHTLEGEIGKLERTTTPPGLTLDFGNSDPRALDFQKADVVTVACVLRSRNKIEEPIKLSGKFSLPVGLDDLTDSVRKPIPPSFYADSIATVCLNLLTELKIPKTAPVGPNMPWKPAVDIEIRDKPLATDPRPPPAKPIAHDDATTPEKPPANTSGNKPASTEPAIDAEDKHKQLIIRNLGTPVILEFGYERQ